MFFREPTGSRAAIFFWIERLPITAKVVGSSPASGHLLLSHREVKEKKATEPWVDSLRSSESSVLSSDSSEKTSNNEVWLSLAERLLWEQDAAGSNPVTSTNPHRAEEILCP